MCSRCSLLIKDYKTEKAEIIKGIHEPIISESLFYKVQEVLTVKKRNKHLRHSKVKEEFPLREFLYCTDNHRMTGSCSCGHGGKYHYYHCPNELKHECFQAEKVNAAFVDLLKSIRIDKEIQEVYRMTVEWMMEPDENQTNALQTKINAQQQRIDVLNDKFIDNHITSQDYTQIKTRYESNLFDLKSQLATITNHEKEFASNFGKSLTLLENLPEYYQSASIEGKRDIIGSIITGKVYFQENKCRTSDFNPLITLLSTPDAAFKGVHRFKKQRYAELSRIVPGTGIEPVQPLLATGF